MKIRVSAVRFRPQPPYCKKQTVKTACFFLYPQFPLPSARTAKTDALPGHVRSLKDSSPIVSPSSVAISLPALCAKLTGRTRSAAVAPLMNVLMIAQIAGVRVKTDQVDQFPATKRFR